MIRNSAYLRQRATALINALDYLYARDLTGLDAPTDTTATAFADRLWREVSPSGTAPEALVNACYRAMQTAYLTLEATNA